MSNQNNENLSKQVYVPSVTSSFFFNEREQEMQNRIFIMNEFIELNKVLIKENKKQYKHLRNTNKNLKTQIEKASRVLNILIKRNKHVRELTEEIKPKHMVGVFESTLSRTFKMKEDQESNDIIIVEVYHDELLHQMLVNEGFTYKNEPYLYFSSSSGQIKDRKCVFIKQKLWEKHENTLMCGLSEKKINAKGGINPNKLLSYLMLTNSATSVWNVDLDRVVVIDDMTTTVNGEVDFVDDVNFTVSRGIRDIEIKQTDGVGFCLASVSNKAFMVRFPWGKGLIVPVPFDKYEGKTKKVTDCWNKEWDIVEDNIQIILHKSQLKLADYYKSWADYKKKFTDHKCEMAIGNVEDEDFADATLTYQILQTLTDISPRELEQITKTTRDKINLIGRDKNVMFGILGVTPENKRKNPLQQAIELYPNLMSDIYVKEVVSQTKKSLVKKSKGGKIQIPNSKYTYCVPDVYAWLQWLFDKETNPSGILGKEKVSCKLYDDGKRLCVERSPHLYKEHGLRDNVVNEETDKWFITNCIYVSVDSLLSKILQYDSDGDKLLIVDDVNFVKIAERNMKGVVPLVYNLRSGDKQIITNEVKYQSLLAGFNSNIGEISNAISRAFHMDDVNDEVLRDVQLLCALNNQEIDYSKTLWRSEVPEEISKRLDKYKRGKLPHVFVYAKKKKEKYVKKLGNGTMDHVAKLIPNTRIHFAELFGDCDYKMLMSNSTIGKKKLNDFIIKKYVELNKSKRFLMFEQQQNNNSRKQAELYAIKYIRKELLKIANRNRVTDVLIHYLYEVKKSENKDTLWGCFGKELIKNLKLNLSKIKQCAKCDNMIECKQGRMYCESCAKKNERERKKIARKINSKKVI